MDLSKLSLTELRGLQDKIKVEMKKREKEEIVKAREQIMAIAQSVGVTLKELVGSQQPRVKSGPVAIRYRHPSDESLQWTGRGRQPRWITDWVEAGNDIDALRVS